MKITFFILAIIIPLYACPQDKISILADYCKEIRDGYIDNNISKLETAIDGYYPATNSTKAEFFYKGTEILLSQWEDGIQIKGDMQHNTTGRCKYFDPSSVDSYIATVKGDVVLNEIPLLRAAPYDFVYSNFTVDKLSKVEIKASGLGETHLLITSDSSEPVAVSVKCNHAKYNKKVTLDSTNPLEIFSLGSDKEFNFSVIVDNKGDKQISVFIAKD